MSCVCGQERAYSNSRSKKKKIKRLARAGATNKRDRCQPRRSYPRASPSAPLARRHGRAEARAAPRPHRRDLHRVRARDRGILRVDRVALPRPPAKAGDRWAAPSFPWLCSPVLDCAAQWCACAALRSVSRATLSQWQSHRHTHTHTLLPLPSLLSLPLLSLVSHAPALTSIRPPASLPPFPGDNVKQTAETCERVPATTYGQVCLCLPLFSRPFLFCEMPLCRNKSCVYLCVCACVCVCVCVCVFPSHHHAFRPSQTTPSSMPPCSALNPPPQSPCPGDLRRRRRLWQARRGAKAVYTPLQRVGPHAGEWWREGRASIRTIALTHSRGLSHSLALEVLHTHPLEIYRNPPLEMISQSPARAQSPHATPPLNLHGLSTATPPRCRSC